MSKRPPEWERVREIMYLIGCSHGQYSKMMLTARELDAAYNVHADTICALFAAHPPRAAMDAGELAVQLQKHMYREGYDVVISVVREVIAAVRAASPETAALREEIEGLRLHDARAMALLDSLGKRVIIHPSDGWEPSVIAEYDSLKANERLPEGKELEGINSEEFETLTATIAALREELRVMEVEKLKVEIDRLINIRFYEGLSDAGVKELKAKRARLAELEGER